MNYRELFIALTVSLCLTIILELCFFIFVGKRNKKDGILVVLVNILTNPLVVLLYWTAVFYTNWNSGMVKIPLELFAVLIEGYCYKRFGCNFRRPFIFSAGANLFSFGIGVLI